MEELVLNKRCNSKSHGARKERKKGLIPGVMYGKKIGNLMFEIGEMDLLKELSITGEHAVLNYDLDGHSGMAIIKDVQKDPVTQKLLHIDLEDVSSGKEIVAEVPIKYHGKRFLSEKGVVLQTQKDCIKVSCRAEDLPSSIDIDVSKAQIGSVYKLSDVEIGGEISVLDDLDSVCASVVREQFIASEENEDSNDSPQF